MLTIHELQELAKIAPAHRLKAVADKIGGYGAETNETLLAVAEMEPQAPMDLEIPWPEVVVLPEEEEIEPDPPPKPKKRK